MKYDNIVPAVFLSRPNRFIANIEIDGKEEVCHVKNTGRCKELLLPGARILVQSVSSPRRSTKFDLISVYKGERLINMDSNAPNRVFREFVEEGLFLGKADFIKPEYRLGQSRLDFYIETNGKRAVAEVKGVTLEKDGVVMFPDAPTERGVKHLKELSEAVKMGYESFAVFIVQMKGVKYFTPNEKTHPEFKAALCEAAEKGVVPLAFDCCVTEDILKISDGVEVVL